MSAELPPQHEGEPLRAYFRRLKTTRDALRAYLPTLRDAAIEAGKSKGLSIPKMAPLMGVSVPWLYGAQDPTRGEYDSALIPDRGENEDALDHYIRLRDLRDVLAEEIESGELASRAKDEAKAEDRRWRNTDVASAMDLSESGLNKLVRRHQNSQGQ